MMVILATLQGRLGWVPSHIVSRYVVRLWFLEPLVYLLALWTEILRELWVVHFPIGSMYGIYANIWGILMVNVTIYGIHGSYGF